MSEKEVSRMQDVAEKPDDHETGPNVLPACEVKPRVTSTDSVPQSEDTFVPDDSAHMLNTLSSVCPGGSVYIGDGYIPDASLLPRVRLKRLLEFPNNEPSFKQLWDAAKAVTSEDDSVSSASSVGHSRSVSDNIAAAESELKADDLKSSRRIKSRLIKRQRLAKDFILDIDESNSEDDHSEPVGALCVSTVCDKEEVARNRRGTDDDLKICLVATSSDNLIADSIVGPKGTASVCHEDATAARGFSSWHDTLAQIPEICQDGLYANSSMRDANVRRSVVELSLRPAPATTGVPAEISTVRAPRKPRQQPICENAWCVLGCVCKGLRNPAANRKREHCGRVECMFSCSCENINGGCVRRRRRRLKLSQVGSGFGYSMNHQAGTTAARVRGTPVVWVPYVHSKRSGPECVASNDGGQPGLAPACGFLMAARSAGCLALPNHPQPLQTSPKLSQPQKTLAGATRALSRSVGAAAVMEDNDVFVVEDNDVFVVENNDVLVVDDDDEQRHVPSSNTGTSGHGCAPSDVSVLALASDGASSSNDSPLPQHGVQAPAHLEVRRKTDSSNQVVSSIAASHPRLNQLLSIAVDSDTEGPNWLQPILPAVSPSMQHGQPVAFEAGMQQSSPVGGQSVEQSSSPILYTVGPAGCSPVGRHAVVQSKPTSKRGSLAHQPSANRRARESSVREIRNQLAVAVTEPGSTPPLAIPGSNITTLLVFRKCSEPSSTPPLQLKVISADTSWESSPTARQNVLTISSQLADDEPEEVLKVTFSDHLIYVYPKNRTNKITGERLSPGELSLEPRYLVLIAHQRPQPPLMMSLPPSAFDRQQMVPKRRPLGQLKDPHGPRVAQSGKAAAANHNQLSPKSVLPAAVANVEPPRTDTATSSGHQDSSLGSTTTTLPSQASCEAQQPASLVTYTVPPSQGASQSLLFVMQEQRAREKNAASTAGNQSVSLLRTHPRGADLVHTPSTQAGGLEPTTSLTESTSSAAALSRNLPDQSQQATAATFGQPGLPAGVVADTLNTFTSIRNDHEVTGNSNSPADLQHLGPSVIALGTVSPPCITSPNPGTIDTCALSPLTCRDGSRVGVCTSDVDRSITHSVSQLPSPGLPTSCNLLSSPPTGGHSESTREEIMQSSPTKTSNLLIDDIITDSPASVRSQQCNQDAELSTPGGMVATSVSKSCATDYLASSCINLAAASSASATMTQQVQQTSVIAELTVQSSAIEEPASEQHQLELPKISLDVLRRESCLDSIEPRNPNADGLSAVKIEPVESTQYEVENISSGIPAHLAARRTDAMPLANETSAALHCRGDTPVTIKKEASDFQMNLLAIPPLSALIPCDAGTLDLPLDHPDMVEPGVLMTFDIDESPCGESDASEDCEDFIEFGGSPYVDGEPSSSSCNTDLVPNHHMDVARANCKIHEYPRPEKPYLSESGKSVEADASSSSLPCVSGTGTRHTFYSEHKARVPEQGICITSDHTVAQEIPGDNNIGHAMQTRQLNVNEMSTHLAVYDKPNSDDSCDLRSSEPVSARYYFFEDHEELFGTSHGREMDTLASVKHQVPDTLGNRNDFSVANSDVAPSGCGDQQSKEAADHVGDNDTSSGSQPRSVEDASSHGSETLTKYSPVSIGWLGYGNIGSNKSFTDSDSTGRFNNVANASDSFIITNAGDTDSERETVGKGQVHLQTSPGLNSPGCSNPDNKSPDPGFCRQTAGKVKQLGRQKPTKIKGRKDIEYDKEKEKNRRRSLSIALSKLSDAVGLPGTDNPSIAHILLTARNFIHHLKLSEIHCRTEKEMLAARGRQLRSNLKRLRRETGSMFVGRPPCE